VDNSPLNMTDPSGLSGWSDCVITGSGSSLAGPLSGRKVTVGDFLGGIGSCSSAIIDYAGQLANEYRWELANFGVGVVCIATAVQTLGSGCGVAVAFLTGFKTWSSYQENGGFNGQFWADSAWNVATAALFLLPGAAAAKELASISERTLAATGVPLSIAQRLVAATGVEAGAIASNLTEFGHPGLPF
jgi:hypothetical protein